MSVDLWAAVDRLTLPTRVPVERAVDADWLIDAAVEQAEIATGRRTNGANTCSVPAYRSALAREAAATAVTASIPSLWDQATQAVGTGREQTGRPSVPLRERSPADLDLMETMRQVSDAVRCELAARGAAAHPDVPFRQSEIRDLARLVTDDVGLWAARLASWARALATYLHAVEGQPKPFRLRAPCPLCKTTWVRVNDKGHLDPDGERLARPIKVDFAGDHVRAAVCEQCGVGWWRGADLHRLAALLDTVGEETMTG